ncbi:LysR substrate-binding domain-containing protein [Micromonospora sp. C28SCA-DRY-2]|uniref:LysR family transcriptional regulator n=1 Tax=Micromonospora sp. C28SCA-DRY-2 TaxID=3059522 RepID=UPI00267705D5|nr:LysR substrate-binding domain-containing protein [Micromonospora sp. C28SCA-DRY-2]MDO3703177.1 LysR substrate-binding domain-containing protein [Micromonospora sp. C28SCA-DRY-2]
MRLNTARLEMLSLLDSLGTVRAVAAALHLSPSAVSAQLAVLEKETRAELLRRSGRRVQLTTAGRTLARHARVILDQLKAAEADLAGSTGQPAGPVRLAAFSSAVRTMVIPLAARLRQAYPRIDLDVTELDPQASHPALRRGDHDIVVTADFIDGSMPLHPDVRTIPLLTDAIVLVVPPSQARDAPAELADFAEAAWSTDMPGTYLSSLVTSTCRKAGFEPVVAGRFASYELLLAHVEAGLSVSLLPELAVDRRYHVATRPLRRPLTRHVYAAVRSRSTLTAAGQIVLDELRELARSTAVPAAGRTPASAPGGAPAVAGHLVAAAADRHGAPPAAARP